jgi:hypothetical protein
MAASARSFARTRAMFHGTSAASPHDPRPIDDADLALWRLVGTWSTTDPAEAATFGVNVIPVSVTLANPLVVSLPATPGDPGMEVAESLGADASQDEPLDVTRLVRSRGHDGVEIIWSDGRAWTVSFDAGATTASSGSPSLSRRRPGDS